MKLCKKEKFPLHHTKYINRQYSETWELETPNGLKNCPEVGGCLFSQVHFYVLNRPRDWSSCPWFLSCPYFSGGLKKGRFTVFVGVYCICYSWFSIPRSISSSLCLPAACGDQPVTGWTVSGRPACCRSLMREIGWYSTTWEPTPCVPPPTSMECPSHAATTSCRSFRGMCWYIRIHGGLARRFTIVKENWHPFYPYIRFNFFTQAMLLAVFWWSAVTVLSWNCKKLTCCFLRVAYLTTIPRTFFQWWQYQAISVFAVVVLQWSLYFMTTK